MRKLWLWVNMLLVWLTVGPATAAPPYWAVPPEERAAWQSTDLSEGMCLPNACCRDGKVHYGKCGHCSVFRRNVCRRHASGQACFHCDCQGSYKYPVPPQSTFFWPGMYSQKTSVDSTMPYRYPMLEEPRWDEPDAAQHPSAAKPVLQQTSLQIPAVEQPQSRPDAELMSRKIDWVQKLW